MSDNVTLPGTGASVATDDAGAGGHIQLIKLAISADGNATLIPATAANGLTVDVTRGDVTIRRDTQRISVQSSGLTTASTAYSAGDQVGAQFTIAGAARASGGTGRIRSVTLIDAADIIGPYDVLITSASVTPASDNAAFSISDSDALETVALIPLTGAYDLGANRLCEALNLDIPYQCTGGTSLYANLITRAGHTFFAATGNLQLIVWVERD